MLDKELKAFANRSKSQVFSERTVLRRKLMRMSQKDLANKVGVSVNTIQSYEDGCLPRGENFLTLAKTLECSLDWLAGMEEGGAQFAAKLTDNAALQNINPLGYLQSNDPLRRQYVLPPLLSHDDDELSYPEKTPISFDLAWIKENTSNQINIRLTTMRGTTMSPTLNEGDLVVIDIGRRDVFQGCIYAISYGGMIMVNRLEIRTNGVLRVISDNTVIAPPYEVSRADIAILGQVSWLWRSMK